ncbi:flavin reductase family protein [Streptomyces sp. N2-109]|uniref:Flavin reductase family protein n=1 Tax=Streptomyces gossypii TaxID=2883101 RepID=A0ABT2JP55_9ACTN|nr:flavin reductase family protein [Streptomyces gossypii]MCT2589150.1 flavin reductase family protein [Streptomyces gossypii]
MNDGTREQQSYRDLMSAFPTGIAVVTSLDVAGRPQGMTCSSMTSATLSPPTLLVCLRTGSATLEAVTSHRRFAVNLLHDGGRGAAEVFSGPHPDRFSWVDWKPSWSGLPWLVHDAFAVAECEVSGARRVGDHTVVFGEVDRISQVDGTPLLYGLRRFVAWPGQEAAEQRRSGRAGPGGWQGPPYASGPGPEPAART